MAGGKGERLLPFTIDMPKPMFPVAGKPLLEHQLLWLRRSGVERAVMCLGYKPEAIRGYFGDGSRWGVSLDYCVEASPRGTAGCVKDAWSRIGGDALIVYGDVFLDISLQDLLACHARNKAAATLVLIETDHPYDSDLVRAEGERVTGFYRARPGEACAPLAAAAVWVVTGGLLDLVPAEVPSDFGRDIFPEALRRGLPLAGFRTAGTVADLGTMDRLAAFEKRRQGQKT